MNHLILNFLQELVTFCVVLMLQYKERTDLIYKLQGNSRLW